MFSAQSFRKMHRIAYQRKSRSMCKQNISAIFAESETNFFARDTLDMQSPLIHSPHLLVILCELVHVELWSSAGRRGLQSAIRLLVHGEHVAVRTCKIREFSLA